MALTASIAAVTAATSIYTANKASKDQKAAINASKEAQENADPFRQYRPEYAERLSALAKDPSSITNTATYKARLQAAERAMASQGYTGSGNAAAAAADAGASAYQQEFENLAMLSGAAQGTGNAVSAYGAGTGAISNANDNRLSAIAGVGNNIANLATMWGGRNTGGGSLADFNRNINSSTNARFVTPGGG